MRTEKLQDCEVVIDTRWTEIINHRQLFRCQWEEILKHGTAQDQDGNKIIIYGKIQKIGLKNAVVLLDQGVLFDVPLKCVRIVQTTVD